MHACIPCSSNHVVAAALYMTDASQGCAGREVCTFRRASPAPSHTGRWKRVCVQAKIQGIARSVSMPPPALRLLGREPMFMVPSSATGVAELKYLHSTRTVNTELQSQYTFIC